MFAKIMVDEAAILLCWIDSVNQEIIFFASYTLVNISRRLFLRLELGILKAHMGTLLYFC